MSSDAPSLLAAWNARIIFGSIAMGFALVVFAVTTFWGSPTNTLHSSAQSWSGALIGLILVGFGVGAGLETYLNRKP